MVVVFSFEVFKFLLVLKANIQENVIHLKLNPTNNKKIAIAKQILLI